MLTTFQQLQAFFQSKQQDFPELRNWTLTQNKRKAALGVANFRKKTIEVSSVLSACVSLEEMKDTVLHEIAHVLAGLQAGHGPAWRAACRKIGAKAERCHLMKTSDILHTFAYLLTCPKCGAQTGVHRVTHKTRFYICKRCVNATGEHHHFEIVKKTS